MPFYDFDPTVRLLKGQDVLDVQQLDALIRDHLNHMVPFVAKVV
jgi:hypothetical protein